MMMVHAGCLFVGCLCVCCRSGDRTTRPWVFFVGLFVLTTLCQKGATLLICCLTKGAYVKI